MTYIFILKDGRTLVCVFAICSQYQHDCDKQQNGSSFPVFHHHLGFYVGLILKTFIFLNNCLQTYVLLKSLLFATYGH
jgi:hypothetical protein